MRHGKATPQQAQGRRPGAQLLRRYEGRRSAIRGSELRGSRALLLACLCLVPAALTLLLLPPAAFALIYGQLLYPSLSSILELLTSWTTVPLGLALLPPLCGILLWRTLSPGRSLPLSARLLRPLLLAVALLSAYFVVWGANYRRPPVLQLLSVHGEVSQSDQLAFAEYLLAWVQAQAHELERTESGGEAFEPDIPPAAERAALASVSAELERLALELGWPAQVPSVVKKLPPGTLLRSGYAGMLFPFTLEAQVDSALSRVSTVAIGAHELAHSAGFATEVDADLAALLAALRSPHPLARYAVTLGLLTRTLGTLAPTERSRIVSSLPPEAVADLTAARERSAHYLRPNLARRVTAVYDHILRGQGIEAGVGDYRRATRLAALLLAEGLLPDPPPLPEDLAYDGGSRLSPAVERYGRAPAAGW